MKRFLKTLTICLFCALAAVGFVACDKKVEFSPTTNVTTSVISNGGVVLRHGNWIYFINGTKTNNAENNKGKTTLAGIYRVMTNDQGQILYKDGTTSSTDSTEEETETKKEFYKIEPVVRSLTGFDDGSIFIFGDFLYYATPCKDKNKDGKMLTGRTEFHRYDLEKKADQRLYTSVKSDDTLTYNYYKQGDELYLVVFEKDSATLKSFKMGSKVEQKLDKKDVTSCLLSENMGECYSEGNQTDNYVYYTLAADADSEILTGSRVFRILPDGTEEKKISEGHTVSLLSIKGGHLIYTEAVSTSTSDTSTFIYAMPISAETAELAFDFSTMVSPKNYADIMFIEEGGKIKTIVYDGHWFLKLGYENGTMVEEKISEMDSSDEVALIGVSGDYIIYQLTSAKSSVSTNRIFKIQYKGNGFDTSTGESMPQPILLSTTKLDEANGLMAPEILNGYVYGFYTQTDTKTTYLYRICIETPRERNEKDDEGAFKQVGEAEFVGVAE